MLLPKTAIFDLDGVLVDTAKFHYLAWKDIATQIGLSFTEADNERLKGVSRSHSLDIILDINNQSMSDCNKRSWLERKNRIYKEHISTLSDKDILPGVFETLNLFKKNNIKIALGSASKNAKQILSATGIESYFDAIVDGNCVTKAKPNPEVFIQAALKLSVKPTDCTVFEDAQAGVKAAIAANMSVVGIGESSQLKEANYVVSNLEQYLTMITNLSPAQNPPNK